MFEELEQWCGSPASFDSSAINLVSLCSAEQSGAQSQAGDAAFTAFNASALASQHRLYPGEDGRPFTDDELVEVSRRGDVRAFGELIQRHYNVCLKRARFVIRNRSDAEDEVQNACWKAFQRLDQYRGEGTFSAWLSRIVENQCLMRIREDRKSHFVYLDEPTESNVKLELVGKLATPEDELGTKQVAKLVRREISRMPPFLRNVMMLRDVEQLSMSEVADRLGLSVPAAKSRLMRARGELRVRLTKHCGPKGCATLTQKSGAVETAYCRAS